MDLELEPAIFLGSREGEHFVRSWKRSCNKDEESPALKDL